MEKEYVNILKEMISPEEFSKLTNQLLNDINNKYHRINILKAIKLVEYNMATILVIGIEQAKNEKQDIKRLIRWYNICPISCLVKTNFKEYINQYKYYIDLIKENNIY